MQGRGGGSVTAQEVTVNNDPVELFTDGACKGNPGPGGWGVLLRWGKREKTLYGSEKDTTNNRMELLAAIKGLSALQERSRVRLHTDSQYVKKGMTEWINGWKQKNWKNSKGQAVKNKDLWEQLDQLCQQQHVEWFWVKAHAGHPDNERVDQLAQKGAVEA